MALRARAALTRQVRWQVYEGGRVTGKVKFDKGYHHRGQVGVYRPGMSNTIEGKLNRHLTGGGKVTHETSSQRDGRGRLIDRTEMRTSTVRSLGQAEKRTAYLEYRENLAERMQEEYVANLFDRKEVKRISSFERAFGVVTKGNQRKFLGAGLNRRKLAYDRQTPVEADGITITGAGFGEDPTRPAAGDGDGDGDGGAESSNNSSSKAGQAGVRVLDSFKQLPAIGGPSMLVLALEGERWDRPTKVQGALWLAAESYRDIVALSLPGSGKTAGYLVPAILRVLALNKEAARAHTNTTTGPSSDPAKKPGNDNDELAFPEEEPRAPVPNASTIPERETTYEGPCAKPRVIIVVPTPELARQVYAVAKRFANPSGVHMGFCAGKAGRMPLDTDILVGTAYRIGYLMACKKISLRDVKMIIVDEADWMMTHKFNDVQTLIMRAQNPVAGDTPAAAAAKLEAMAGASIMYPPMSGGKKRKGKKGKKKKKAATADAVAEAEATTVGPADTPAASPLTADVDSAPTAKGVEDAAGLDRLQLMFVASTWSEHSAAAAAPFLKSPVTLRVSGKVFNEEGDAVRLSDAALPSVQHRVHVVPDADRAAFISLMFTHEILPLERHKYLVFASDVTAVEKLYDVLYATLPPGCVRMAHEDQYDFQRDNAIEGMQEDETVRVLVATDFLARGIDLPNISGVVNYDLADNTHTLFQRMGRTGRGDRHGVAHSFVNDTTPRERVQEIVDSLDARERHPALMDLLRDEGEKASFVKQMEKRASKRQVSFDTIDTCL